MYLPNVVALLCTESYVFGGLFPGCFCLLRMWQRELIILNYHFQQYSWYRADSVFMC